MEHHMGGDKIEQNAQRLRAFLFHTLGCSTEDAIKIISVFAKHYLYENSFAVDTTSMEAVERWAEFVRTHPRSEWKKEVTTITDDYFKKLADKHPMLDK